MGLAENLTDDWLITLAFSVNPQRGQSGRSILRFAMYGTADYISEGLIASPCSEPSPISLT